MYNKNITITAAAPAIPLFGDKKCIHFDYFYNNTNCTLVVYDDLIKLRYYNNIYSTNSVISELSEEDLFQESFKEIYNYVPINFVIIIQYIGRNILKNKNYAELYNLKGTQIEY